MAPTLTPRQTYRALVAEVAAKAKVKLPECNGRVESATALVLAGDVFVRDNGTVEVGSCTDPLTMHRLVGSSCTCEDFQYGRAPGSWCKHRLAHAIATRVHQEMSARSTPVESEPEVELPADFEMYPDNDAEAIEEPPTPAPAPLPEARSSANVRLMVHGYEAQITLRDHDEAALMVRLTALIHGYGQPQTPPVASPPAASAERRFCPLHGTAMQRNEKEGRSWWSHRTADGQWCKGK